MLDQLHIQNFVLIDQLTLNFSQGLTVLTGETGAGKSILLDAFGLILGDKSQARFIRPSTTQATITATFNFPKSSLIHQQLDNFAIHFDETIIIRRQISLDGKSKSFINDQPVSLNLLKELAGNLVDIHGQFDQILSPTTHLTILDQFCAKPDLKYEVTTAYKTYHDYLQQLISLNAKLDHKDSHLDYLKNVLDELDHFDLKDNEEEHLIAQRTIALNNDKIVKAVQSMHHHLIAEDGIQNQVYEIVQTAQRLPSNNLDFDPVTERLVALEQIIQDIVSEIEDRKYRLKSEVLNVEQIDDRLHQLRFLARKHHCLTGQLMEKWQLLKVEYQDLLKAEENKAKLEQSLQAARQQFISIATTLSTLRQQAALEFATQVECELSPLKLDKVKIKVQITKLNEEKWHQDGIDHVEFMIQTNPGHPFNSIAKVASGGERSRLMLAFKVVLAAYQHACLLIFDEIDSGVGGAVAAAIGERLGRLSKQQQVISVTHSPQVASYAQHHYLVTKTVVNDQAQAVVKHLPQSERLEEIARMLSGEDVTDAARGAAQELLQISA